MPEVTYHVKVLTMYTDPMGYTSIVFENLEYTDPDYRYIMAVRFPNWESYAFDLNDIGFVNVRYVVGGVDKWFDGKSFNTYQYSNVIFLKFIPEKSKIDITDITVD